MDNKGTAVTIEPGRTFKEISLNVIENFVPRSVPACGQEDTYSTPVCDGARMYIRGEENLTAWGRSRGRESETANHSAGFARNRTRAGKRGQEPFPVVTDT